MQIEKLWILHLLSLAVICKGKVPPKKLVCVIGAGRAGLAAIKLVSNKSEIFDVVAYERNSDVGGLWIYRDRMYLDEHGLPAHSGIYKHLMTNTPKDWMAYPDFPQIRNGEISNYMPHEVFLEYLKNYTNYFDLRKNIKFNSLVTKVIPEYDPRDRKTMTWKVEVQTLNTDEKSSINCNALIVCNGRYSKPNKPLIPGLYETFPGPILHSRSYRKPGDFTGKTVAILGAGASSIDIAIDLSGYAKKVYHSHKHEEQPYYGIRRPKNVQEVYGVVKADGNRLTLQDNSTIVANVFIFCTGYLLDFPFLGEESGVVVVNNTVPGLFRRALNMLYPSMAVIGLPTAKNYGALYYDQINWFLDILQNKTGKIEYEDES